MIWYDTYDVGDLTSVGIYKGRLVNNFTLLKTNIRCGFSINVPTLCALTYKFCINVAACDVLVQSWCSEYTQTTIKCGLCVVNRLVSSISGKHTVRVNL